MKIPQRKSVLITGTIGSGKSTVAVELGRLLEDRGLAVAVIDLDWLGWAHLRDLGAVSVDDLIARNLADVWRNYQAAGVDLLILTRAVWEEAQLSKIRSALAGVELKVARLLVEPEQVTARLRARDSGRTLEEHLEEARTIAAHLDANKIEDFSLANDSIPEATALTLGRQLGWLT